MSKTTFRLTPEDFMDETIDDDGLSYTEINCEVDTWKCCECRMPVGFSIHTDLDRPTLSRLIWTNTWVNPDTQSYYCEDCVPEGSQ